MQTILKKGRLKVSPEMTQHPGKGSVGNMRWCFEYLAKKNIFLALLQKELKKKSLFGVADFKIFKQ